MGRATTPGFRFHIEAASTITKRGTVVIGYILQGMVRSGDALEFHHAGASRPVECHRVEFVDDLHRSRELPPLLGLWIPALEPSDISEGDELTSPVSN